MQGDVVEAQVIRQHKQNVGSCTPFTQPHSPFNSICLYQQARVVYERISTKVHLERARFPPDCFCGGGDGGHLRAGGGGSAQLLPPQVLSLNIPPAPTAWQLTPRPFVMQL